MDTSRLLPFERNRYYVGKLLTSADFQVEQAYNRNKRRFLNQLMFGSGIVCGLGVYSLDDQSIMVDSGAAVDGCGREIAVESPAVRKLSAIEGFESLESGRAVLCLRSQEEDVHPVYTVQSREGGESYECNHVREGWQLFLRDSGSIPSQFQPEPEFLAMAPLYEDGDYSVTCAMPARSACGASVRLDVTVRRLRPEAGPLTLRAAIQTPAFTGEDGGHELILELLDLCPEESATIRRFLRAQSTPAPESVLLVSAEGVQVQVGGESRTAAAGFTLRSAVVAATTAQIVDQAVSSAGLEPRAAAGGRDFVPLAEIVLQRTRSAYLIEEVQGDGVRAYIRTCSDAALRQELEDWFRPSSRPVPAPAGREQGGPREWVTEPIYASGVCEIPLAPGMRRGQVAYSDEIVHGLGPGTVYVDVGAEYLADDPKLGVPARNTVYGAAELFSEGLPQAVEAAVKVMNDRGSFIAAVRLLADSTQVVLPLRWVAVMMPGGDVENRVQKLAGKSIAAIQPTVVMATRSSHFFNVRFNNMEPCTLTYELTEKDSGEITSDGIYTAPGREGVFEIRISCAELPLVSTYAYAVVKKRDALEEA